MDTNSNIFEEAERRFQEKAKGEGIPLLRISATGPKPDMRLLLTEIAEDFEEGSPQPGDGPGPR